MWSYPPSIMLLAAPFGLLPYEVALVLWLLLGFAAFVYAALPWLTSPLAITLILVAPAALMQHHSGQNAYLFGALLIGGYRLAKSRPALAGACFAVLTVKPQLGLLVPIILLAAGYRRAFWWSVALGIAFNGASVLAFGLEPWRMYAGLGFQAQLSVLRNNDAIAHQFMPSLYISLQLLGLPSLAAMFGQVLLLRLLVIGVNRVNGLDEETRLGFWLAATIAATPYMMGYDLLVCIITVLIAIRRFRAKPHR